MRDPTDGQCRSWSAGVCRVRRRTMQGRTRLDRSQARLGERTPEQRAGGPKPHGSQSIWANDTQFWQTSRAERALYMGCATTRSGSRKDELIPRELMRDRRQMRTVPDRVVVCGGQLMSSHRRDGQSSNSGMAIKFMLRGTEKTPAQSARATRPLTYDALRAGRGRAACTLSAW